ncbi:MAG: EamA family transporter [Nitrospirae bacterium]|nr:EamA family transporter [Nitrospirota bacterium]
MNYTWIYLTLISAFSLATSDALLKSSLKEGNEYLLGWLRFVISLPFLLIVLLYIPVPELDRKFYMAFFSALPLEIVAMALYLKAIQLSPLSLTLPFLSLTPLFLTVASPVITSEGISLKGSLGIFFVTLGSYCLNLNRIREGFLEPFRAILREKGSIYMIIVAFIYSITSSLGKVAVEHSSPMFFGATYFTVVTVAFTPLIILNRNAIRIKKSFNLKYIYVALSGLFFALMIISHMYAIDIANVAYMISIKRSSLLIGSLYGFIFFHEKQVLERLVGATLMFVGFVLIVTGG